MPFRIHFHISAHLRIPAILFGGKKTRIFGVFSWFFVVFVVKSWLNFFLNVTIVCGGLFYPRKVIHSLNLSKLIFCAKSQNKSLTMVHPWYYICKLTKPWEQILHLRCANSIYFAKRDKFYHQVSALAPSNKLPMLLYNLHWWKAEFRFILLQ